MLKLDSFFFPLQKIVSTKASLYCWVCSCGLTSSLLCPGQHVCIYVNILRLWFTALEYISKSGTVIISVFFFALMIDLIRFICLCDFVLILFCSSVRNDISGLVGIVLNLVKSGNSNNNLFLIFLFLLVTYLFNGPVWISLVFFLLVF